eukprot:7624-Hanusia_phi.AAC.3
MGVSCRDHSLLRSSAASQGYCKAGRQLEKLGHFSMETSNKRKRIHLNLFVPLHGIASPLNDWCMV